MLSNQAPECGKRLLELEMLVMEQVLRGLLSCGGVVCGVCMPRFVAVLCIALNLW